MHRYGSVCSHRTYILFYHQFIIIVNLFLENGTLYDILCINKDIVFTINPLDLALPKRANNNEGDL
ncbi:hypothetical protein SAMN04488508_1193 [Aquimarina spongiae]|uniref:Uncharacterized protein n=1 Tax=Aquimarina spongiae TaxID=570521 RepID=A0A1M6LKC4_9FLAO|nr:hypothetical protein SAMN04488508_1193 [Aquimarina spongiae]